MTNQPKRSKGDPFFNEPKPPIVLGGGMGAAEPIEPETKPEPQNAPAPVSVPEGELITNSDTPDGLVCIKWTPVLWSGIKIVYRCNVCDECRDTKDEAALHLLKHVPDSEHDQALSSLLEGFAYYVKKEK